MSEKMELPSFRPYSKADLRMYAAMEDEIMKSGYMGFLQPREPNPTHDPFDVLRLESVHIPPEEIFDSKAFEHIGQLLENSVIKPESRQTIVAQLKDLLIEISPWLEKGWNVAIATNHMSYVDLLLLQHCLAAAEVEMGVTPRINKHHMIIRRSVGLFAMEGLKPNGNSGYIVDDALLKLGGVFQTLSLEYKLDGVSDETRDSLAKRFFERYMEILREGGNISLIVANGKEDVVENGSIRVPKVNSGTGELFAQPNRIRLIKNPQTGQVFKEIVGPTTISVAAFLNWQPLDKTHHPKGPVDAKLALGAPFITAKKREFEHRFGRQIVSLGNATTKKGLVVTYGDD